MLDVEAKSGYSFSILILSSGELVLPPVQLLFFFSSFPEKSNVPTFRQVRTSRHANGPGNCQMEISRLLCISMQ